MPIIDDLNCCFLTLFEMEKNPLSKTKKNKIMTRVNKNNREKKIKSAKYKELTTDRVRSTLYPFWKQQKQIYIFIYLLSALLRWHFFDLTRKRRFSVYSNNTTTSSSGKKITHVEFSHDFYWSICMYVCARVCVCDRATKCNLKVS